MFGSTTVCLWGFYKHWISLLSSLLMPPWTSEPLNGSMGPGAGQTITGYVGMEKLCAHKVEQSVPGN
jgi:hypothetical protein